MLKKLAQHAIVALSEGSFSKFDDILAHDGGSFAVHEQFADAFPGRISGNAPVAVELHFTMSLLTDNVTNVKISPDTTSDVHSLPDPSALNDKLILIDRGYDSMAAIDAIH